MIFALASVAVPMPIAEVVVVRAERLTIPAEASLSLTGDVLENQVGGRLDEALRIVPGFGLFRRTSSGAANATIQGISLRPIAPNGAGRALVSLDKVPQNDPFGGWIFWSRYDPIFLEKVEVKRGGDGAGFGPMALTGTLDLTEARGQRPLLDVRYGDLASAHGAARASVQTRGAVFTAMAVYDASAGARAISSRQRGPVDRPVNFEAVSATLVTDIGRDNGAWSFRASGFSESKGAGLVGGQSQAQGLDVSAARRFEGAWGQSRFILYAQGRDFSNQTVAVSLGRTTATPALDQFTTPSSALGGSIAFLPNQTSNLPSLTLEARRAEGETRELFRYIVPRFTRARRAGGQQDLVGLGVAMPRPVILGGGQLRFDAGVRVDYWANSAAIRHETDRATNNAILIERGKDNSGTVATGRMSLAQVRGPARLSLYRTFRPPTLNELHRPFRIGNDVTEANTALMPETLLGLDVNLSDTRPSKGGRLVSSLTLYLNRLDDPIANVTLANGPGTFARVGFLPAGGSLRERRNVGRIDAKGLEARIAWEDANSTLSWSVAASMTDAVVTGGIVLPQLTGKRPAQAPTWSAAASLQWPLTQAVSLHATVRGESARFEDDLNSRELAAYGALDVRAAWQVNPRLQLYVTGENMLDERIATAIAGDGIVSTAQGRMFRVGLKFTQ